MRKRILSVLLVAIMLMVMVPASAITAFATEPTVITSVEIGDPVQLNVAYTEKQIYKAIGNDYYLAPEEAGYAVDPSNSYLAYYVPSTGNMIGATEQTALSTEKAYYVGVTLTLKSGYDWPAGMKNNSSPDFTGFTATVGGNVVDLSEDIADYYYNDYWNTVLFFVSAGEVSTAGIVTSVTVDPAVKSLTKGEGFTFTATVEGTAAKTVDWAVEGNSSAGTVIDENGALTVGEDETATSLVVKAISTVDDTKIGTAIVTVLDDAPTIILSGVPSALSLYPNDTSSIGAYITGTETNRELEWTLSGNESDATTITVYDMYQSGTEEWFQSCEVKIGNDETAESITLTVRSVAHPEVVKTTVITVLTATELSEIRLTLDLDAAALDPDKTEGEVGDILRDNLSFNGSGFSTGNVYLLYFADPSWHGIGGGTDPVDLQKVYGVSVQIRLNTGYVWPQEVILESDFGLDVFLNDAPIEVVSWSYNSYYNSVDIIILPALVDAEFTGASLDIGTGLDMNFAVRINDAEDVAESDLAVRFEMNGKTLLVDYFTKDGDFLIFKYNRIAPDLMMADITATLVLLEDDGVSVARVLDQKVYSIYQYIKDLRKVGVDAVTEQLLSDLIVYGGAAAAYRGTTDIRNHLSHTASDVLPEAGDKMTVTGNDNADYKFISGGVWFDHTIQMYLKIHAVSDDFTIKYGGITLYATYCEKLDETTYKLMSPAVAAAELMDTEFVMVLKNGDTEVATITIDLAAYTLARMAGEDGAGKDLAIAVYRYAASAKAYAAAHP